MEGMAIRFSILGLLASVACSGSGTGGDGGSGGGGGGTLVEELIGRTSLLNGHGPGSYYQTTSDSWCTEVWEIADAAHMQYVARITELGTSGLTLNDETCRAEFDLTAEPISGFEPSERMLLTRNITVETCGDSAVGEVQTQVFAALKRDSAGELMYWTRWDHVTPDEQIPPSDFVNWGGDLRLYRVCPDGSDLGDTGCVSTCSWPDAGDPTGPSCPRTVADL